MEAGRWPESLGCADHPPPIRLADDTFLPHHVGFCQLLALSLLLNCFSLLKVPCSSAPRRCDIWAHRTGGQDEQPQCCLDSSCYETLRPTQPCRPPVRPSEAKAIGIGPRRSRGPSLFQHHPSASVSIILSGPGLGGMFLSSSTYMNATPRHAT